MKLLNVKLNPADESLVRQAIAVRRWLVPGGATESDGAVVAQIVMEWLEMQERLRAGKGGDA